ncbi:DUF6279 family lipoprotein [Oceanicoccus sp. KOV_DT_Chl]|uniref:DUF6279 family lipoprotein n=1 Tax=Oceanicoccus sp. KOV_DT_Chl TaxID=1904639 RepID=UPI000C7A431E|nr:DUF6279 family lipoprotein [Oceanicoccus sp. KOV_DT_Chl]
MAFIHSVFSRLTAVVSSPIAKRIQVLSLVLLASIFVTSCTAKASYRFLDWVVAWSVDDYVDWDRSQQVDFDQRVQVLLAWHHAELVPQYAGLLRQLHEDVQQPLVRELLVQRVDQTEVLFTQLLTRVQPDAVALLSSLSDKQVLDVEKNLASAVEKLEKKYLQESADQQSSRRIKSVKKFATSMLGKLSKEQLGMIATWEQQVSGSELWLESRKRWNTKFMQALNSRAEPGFSQQIHQLFVEPQSLWSAEYQQVSTDNMNHGIDLAIAFQQSLSEKQQQHLLDELEQWLKTIEELPAW